MSGDRNLYCRKQGEGRWNRRAGRSVRGTGHRKCCFRRDWEANSPAADPDDGGCMKRAEDGTRFLLMSLIVLVIAVAMWFSHSVAAAKPSATGKAASPGSDDGALFTALVPVLR